MNLTDISEVKRLLNKHGLNFNKALGQNFLIDAGAVEQIAYNAVLDDKTGIIEIGCGIGTLTRELAKNACKVIGIEIDKNLKPVLNITLGEFENVTVYYADVLKTDIKKIIDEQLQGLKICICSNLPYYITTPIVMYLLEQNLPVDSIVLMMQKEVALRLCAKEGTSDYGAITLAVNYKATPSILFDVPNTSFVPPPKVTSTVIKLDVLKTPLVEVKEPKKLFLLIKAAFAQRRKTLVNAIANFGGLNLQKSDIISALEKMGKNPDIRGETLSLEQFAELYNLLY